MEPAISESLGVPDPGKWMPFAFHLDIVDAVKLTSDEDDHELFGCATIFTNSGDTYIIDTPYKKFLKIFLDHHKNQ